MISLQITEKKAASLNEIEELSLDTIKKALNGDMDTSDDAVKVAAKMMGVVAKNRQTMTNRCAIEFNMASTIASEAQLEKYIAATMPEVKKALGPA